MKFNLPINNFTAGEWSQRMRARMDTEQYVRACQRIENFLPQMQGGAAYRGGTLVHRFLDNAADQDDIIQAGVTNIKLETYEPSNPNFRTILTINPDPHPWRVLTGANVTLAAGTTTSTWNPQLTDRTQIGDLLFLTCKDGLNPPKVFYYNQTTSQFTLANLIGGYVTDRPWKVNPWGPIGLVSAGAGHTVQVPARANTVGTTFDVLFSGGFTATDVGRYIRLCNGTSVEGVVQINSISSLNVANVTLRAPLHTAGAFIYGSPANPTSFWQMSQWFTGNWPRTVTSFQGRLIFGGSPNAPDTLWGSRIANIFDFAEVPSPDTTGVSGFASGAWTNDNSRPFTLTPNTGVSTVIKGLSSAKTLVILTDQCEIVGYGTNGALGPLNVKFESSSSFGSSDVSPVRINNYLTFAQATGKKVRDVIFNFDQDQFKSTDLAFPAEHYFKDIYNFDGIDRIAEMVRWETDSSMLIVRTQSGKLYGVTLDRDYSVNAWFRVTIGTSSNQRTMAPPISYPYVISTTVRTNPVDRRKELVVATIRVNKANEKLFCLEMFQAPWDLMNPLVPETAGNIASRPVYLDMSSFASAVGRIDDEPVDTWALDALLYANETFSVVADGAYIGEFTADAGGQFTTPHKYGEVYVGFLYPGIIHTNPLEVGGQIGQPMGRIKRVDEAVVRFDASMGCKIGPHADALEELPMRSGTQPMGQSPQYYTGDKVVTFPPSYDRDFAVYILQDKPYPCYVVGVAVKGVTYD